MKKLLSKLAKSKCVKVKGNVSKTINTENIMNHAKSYPFWLNIGGRGMRGENIKSVAVGAGLATRGSLTSCLFGFKLDHTSRGLLFSMPNISNGVSSTNSCKLLPL